MLFSIVKEEEMEPASWLANLSKREECAKDRRWDSRTGACTKKHVAGKDHKALVQLHRMLELEVGLKKVASTSLSFLFSSMLQVHEQPLMAKCPWKSKGH